MATITWYGAGVSSVATGSRTVTGTGTGWLTAVAGLTPIKAGDKYGLHVGRPIVIENIVSDTELLLADDWPGQAQTDAPYKIELTSPTIAAVEAMRRLLVSLSNGNLESLADTPVALDQIPIGIGPGIFSLVNKHELGLVGGPSAAPDGAFAGFDGGDGNLLKALTALQALSIVKGAGAYAKDNILGTVSQLAGVPTGAIFEPGNNANGRYWRHADGFQACIKFVPVSSVAIGGGGFQTYNLGNHAAAFAATPFEVAVYIGDNSLLITIGLESVSSVFAGNAVLRNNLNESRTFSGSIAVCSVGRWL